MMNRLLCVLFLLLLAIPGRSDSRTEEEWLEMYRQTEDSSLLLSYIDSIFLTYAYSLPPDTYFELAQKKYELVKNSTDTAILGQAYHTLGKAYIKHQAFDTAMNYFLEGLELFELIKDSSGRAKMYNGIAHCYQWSDPEKSIEYYQKAIDFSDPNNRFFIGTQLMNKASQVVNLKRYEEGIEIYELALDYLKESPAMLGTVYMNMGVVHYREGRIEKSIESQKNALNYLSPSNNLATYITNLQNLGLNYYQLQDYEQAKDYVQQSMELAEEHQIGDRLAKGYAIIVAILEQQQSYEEALGYYKTYFDLNDSIVEARKNDKIAELLTQFEAEKKEAEIQRLDAENQLKDVKIEKSQQERFLWIGGVVGLLAILGLISYFFQNNRKKNLLLEEKNVLISEALAEKETLLKEIHHRVKNNLQVISSLLSLQAKQIEDHTALEAIQEGQNRVKSMALIHQNLYQEENLVGVNVQEYVEKLIDSLVRSYNINTEQIEVLKDIDPVKFDVDTIIPLGLILNELISNVLKYAFEGRKEGKIEVSLKSQKDQVTLEVADNGIGLPDSFDPVKNRSLGFRLIRAFANKLNAQIDIQRQPGTRVSILVPNLQTV